MIVYLLDGTHEVFRYFYGVRRYTKGEDPPFEAVVGVLHSVADDRDGSNTHRCGDRSHHRVLPQQSLVWLQDGPP
jgi:hypothetical protein